MFVNFSFIVISRDYKINKMPKENLVSVILPNYNHAKFLNKRIESIINQSYKSFELIILDDCSTDNSRDIINRYKDSEHVSHIVFNNENSGSTFHQWEKGFALAKGEYIWIAESDDYSDPDFLQKMVPLLNQNTKCQIVFCNSYLIDENDNKLLQDWDKPINGNAQSAEYDGYCFLRKYMFFDNAIYNAGMALFRKSALTNLDHCYMKFTFCGDWYFWNKICIQGTVIHLGEKLNYFRQHSCKVTPRAEQQGLKFLEGKYILQDSINILSLTSIQQKVIIGRYLVRIRKYKLYSNKHIMIRVYKDVKKFFHASIFYIFMYEIDKFMNISSLNLGRRNKSL